MSEFVAPELSLSVLTAVASPTIRETGKRGRGWGVGGGGGGGFRLLDQVECKFMVPEQLKPCTALCKTCHRSP